jgi:hypothetical protein
MIINQCIFTRDRNIYIVKLKNEKTNMNVSGGKLYSMSGMANHCKGASSPSTASAVNIHKSSTQSNGAIVLFLNKVVRLSQNRSISETKLKNLLP